MKRIITLVYMFLCLFYCSVALADTAGEQPKTISAATIYETMLVLPVAVQDRDDPRKQDQLYSIAVAIERAIPQVNWPENDKAGLAAYLVTIGWHESRFRIKIHEGVKHSYSYGIWQITPQAYHVARTELIGLSQEETDHTATIAARAISVSWHCGSRPEDHFTSYYGGVPCGKDWKTLRQRVNTFWYVRGLIIRFEKERNND